MQRSIAPQSTFPRARRLRELLEAALGTLYGLSGRTGYDLTRTASGIAVLARNEVRRIDETDGVRYVEVLEGSVWITATPAAGDALLRAGDCLPLEDGWPFVAQALEPARVLLAPLPPSAACMKPFSSRLAPRPKKYR